MITEKQITSIKISDDLNEVKIGFTNVLTHESENEEEGNHIHNSYLVKGKIRPHKDFIEEMKKLRKFALELCEMDVNSKEIGDWNVCGLQIAGDIFLHQSRAVLQLAKKVNRTNKVIKFKTPQVTMFPEADEATRYASAEKLTTQIECCIEEAYNYLNGKYEDEGIQFQLFPNDPKLETHFTR